MTIGARAPGSIVSDAPAGACASGARASGLTSWVWVVPAPVEGSDLTVSNAYPRPDAGEPEWPDPGGRSRLDDQAPRPRDAGAHGDHDRELRGLPRAPHGSGAADRGLVGDDRPAAPDADAPPERDPVARRAPDEIEDAVPATRRLRDALARLMATVRASVPLRSALFVLPPLVLPALAFDLSLGAALVVSVLLLWLAAAAGVVATMMFDGSDQLALRAIERRLDQLPVGGRAADDEALLTVGTQLDALNDRLDELTPVRHRTGAPAIDHRPQEQWSTPEDVPQNDRYDHDVGPGRHWSPSRWER